MGNGHPSPSPGLNPVLFAPPVRTTIGYPDVNILANPQMPTTPINPALDFLQGSPAFNPAPGPMGPGGFP